MYCTNQTCPTRHTRHTHHTHHTHHHTVTNQTPPPLDQPNPTTPPHLAEVLIRVIALLLGRRIAMLLL